MELRLCLVLLAATLLLAVPIVPNQNKQTTLSASVSLHGYDISLSKAQQKAFATHTWFELHDKHYNSKGFTQWKPSNTGFMVKHNKGTILDCSSGKAEGDDKIMKVSFSCQKIAAPMRFKKKSFFGSANKPKSFSLFGHTFKYTKSTAHGPLVRGGSTALLNQKFTDPLAKSFANKLVFRQKKYTPIQTPRLIPQKEQQHMDAGERARRIANDVDDTDYEGEPSFNRREDPEQSQDQHDAERNWIERLDSGSASQGGHGHKVLRGSHGAALLNDVPYPDAGVDRETNDRMFEFLKTHPQYHLPEAQHMSAAIWKEWMEAHDPGAGAGINPGAQYEGTGVGVGEVAPGQKMWKDCKERLPQDWPASAPIKCQQFAVTPVGYWGCDWLFEDGTCGKVKFYPTMRWDGLDAYVTSPSDRASEFPEGYKAPNEYHGENLAEFRSQGKEDRR